MDDGTIILAKIRNTFVWKEVDGELILLHIHGSHARDIPLEYEGALPSSFEKDTLWFQYLKDVDRMVGLPKKITFKEVGGSYRFILPSQILYIKADNKYCTIVTNSEHFLSKVTLKELEEKTPLFVIIHRSYLVNLWHISSIKRYKASLSNHELLPISKERYLYIKDLLGKRRDCR